MRPITSASRLMFKSVHRLSVKKPSNLCVTPNCAQNYRWYMDPSYKGPVIRLITRFMGPTWGLSGADRTHVGPMLAPWALLSGYTFYCATLPIQQNLFEIIYWKEDDLKTVSVLPVMHPHWWIYHLNPLWPYNAIWHHRTCQHWIACRLTAPSHYLNTCWLITREVLWYLPEGILTRNAKDIHSKYQFENDLFQIKAASLMGHMMTSSNGNIFRVTGHLCGEFTGPRWIPLTKASDTELWCFLWAWINCWVNNREAGDLRRYRAHYDVIVMNGFNQNGLISSTNTEAETQRNWV